MYIVRSYVHGKLQGMRQVETQPNPSMILRDCDGYMVRNLETGAVEVHLKIMYDGCLDFKRYKRNYYALLKPLEGWRFQEAGSIEATTSKLGATFRSFSGPGSGLLVQFH